MIENILSLSILLHSNKGVYALLLGSGISRAAGVPTGWEVTLDLVQKLAHLENQDPGPDSEKWFLEKYGQDPTYSFLLENLARTSTERTKLLRRYFEPNEDEREQGFKIPTKAHHAIASLVVNGTIRVIVTTNFDRLLEQALTEQGVNPVVINTSDAAKGALPLSHSPCTIIKLHGDYLDTRIKNTVSELSDYDKGINNLLDQIFDEYGLIVCGWSAAYDAGLRKALQRQKSRRFTTFWTTLDEVGPEAKILITHRAAEIIRIEGADQFFSQLLENLKSLDQVNRTHPVSISLAIAQIKRYITNHDYISVHDLIMAETSEIYSQLDKSFLVEQASQVAPNVKNYIETYEAICDKLIVMITTAAYWGSENTIDVIVKVVEWLGNPPAQSHEGTWTQIRKYPALMIIYAAGIALVSRKDFVSLRKLFFEPKNHERYSNRGELILEFHHSQIVDPSHMNTLFDNKNYHVPVSERIFEKLMSSFAPILPNHEGFAMAFDEFEYFFCLSFTKAFFAQKKRYWGPVGRFAYLKNNYDRLAIPERIAKDYDDADFEALLGTNDKEEIESLRSGFTEFIYSVANSFSWR